MTEAAGMPRAAVEGRIVAGAIVLVVGPSGAGKDTLIRLAKAHFSGTESIVFPRRLITRPTDPHEDHVAIDRHALSEKERAGELALRWQAHGLDYAVPGEIDAAISGGAVVIVNVSRKIVPEALAKYAHAVVVYVTAPPQVLAERLKARGRETEEDVAGRLDRAEGGGRPDGPNVVTIENVGDPAGAARRLVDLVEGLRRAVSH